MMDVIPRASDDVIGLITDRRRALVMDVIPRASDDVIRVLTDAGALVMDVIPRASDDVIRGTDRRRRPCDGRYPPSI